MKSSMVEHKISNNFLLQPESKNGYSMLQVSIYLIISKLRYLQVFETLLNKILQ